MNSLSHHCNLYEIKNLWKLMKICCKKTWHGRTTEWTRIRKDMVEAGLVTDDRCRWRTIVEE